MSYLKSMLLFLKNWLQIFTWFITSLFKTHIQKDLEILALRSQLSIFKQQMINHKISKPHFTTAFRQLWIILSKKFSYWKSSLIIVKPETVVKWHRKAFKLLWKNKSRKKGRPKLSREIINLIKRIHKENPLLSPEKIYERLVDLNISNPPTPNTIAKYIPKIRKPPTQNQIQSWKTFLKNHSKGIWAMDFMVVPTLFFEVLYVLVIINHRNREIKHIAVTPKPTSQWVSQQIREATPYQQTPKYKVNCRKAREGSLGYLIHDNDTIFRDQLFQDFLKNCDIKSKRTAYKSPWQNGIAERCIGILRTELLNHIIPFNQRHLQQLLKEFVNNYYNTVRTHQGIGCQTPILKEKPKETKIESTILVSKPILNGLYCDYDKVA
jgi:putative transposase